MDPNDDRQDILRKLAEYYKQGGPATPPQQVPIAPQQMALPLPRPIPQPYAQPQNMEQYAHNLGQQIRGLNPFQGPQAPQVAPDRTRVIRPSESEMYQDDNAQLIHHQLANSPELENLPKRFDNLKKKFTDQQEISQKDIHKAVGKPQPVIELSGTPEEQEEQVSKTKVGQ